jgi:hypothetical protein
MKKKVIERTSALNYKINKILVNQKKTNFSWVTMQRTLSLTAFSEVSREMRLKAIEGLEADLDYEMTVEVTLSINDYSVREQTISFIWNISSINLPVHALLIEALLKRCFKDKLETENMDELAHWTWEVKQLLEELYQDKLSQNDQEVMV